MDFIGENKLNFYSKYPLDMTKDFIYTGE